MNDDGSCLNGMVGKCQKQAGSCESHRAHPVKPPSLNINNHNIILSFCVYLIDSRAADAHKTHLPEM